jgi:HEAT repeats
MSGPSRHDLSSWTDTDDLVHSLGRVKLDQRDELYDAIENLLSHQDPDVREEAVRILGILWKAREAHAGLLNAMLHDPEPEVRGAASYAVVATSSSSSRKNDVNALLAILRDDTQPTFVRGTAYDGLLILHQRRQFPSMTKEFQPTRDIDWDWIAAVEKGDS